MVELSIIKGNIDYILHSQITIDNKCTKQLFSLFFNKTYSIAYKSHLFHMLNLAGYPVT